jgi:hypothetical protein
MSYHGEVRGLGKDEESGEGGTIRSGRVCCSGRIVFGALALEGRMPADIVSSRTGRGRLAAWQCADTKGGAGRACPV